MKHRAVFLDRDGVINDVVIKEGKPYPPSSLKELIIPNDVPFALHELKKLGFRLIVVTNQPDVARGTTSQETVEAIHNYLKTTLPIDDIRTCYHDDGDQCVCRKPQPGLLFKAAFDHQIKLEQSIMIGDRWKDILAGQRALCKTIWLNREYDEAKPVAPDYQTTTLLDAAQWIKHKQTRGDYDH